MHIIYLSCTNADSSRICMNRSYALNYTINIHHIAYNIKHLTVTRCMNYHALQQTCAFLLTLSLCGSFGSTLLAGTPVGRLEFSFLCCSEVHDIYKKNEVTETMA